LTREIDAATRLAELLGRLLLLPSTARTPLVRASGAFADRGRVHSATHGGQQEQEREEDAGLQRVERLSLLLESIQHSTLDSFPAINQGESLAKREYYSSHVSFRLMYCVSSIAVLPPGLWRAHRTEASSRRVSIALELL